MQTPDHFTSAASVRCCFDCPTVTLLYCAGLLAAGTVESFMAEAGKKSLLQFLEAVKALVRHACLFRVYVYNPCVRNKFCAAGKPAKLFEGRRACHGAYEAEIETVCHVPSCVQVPGVQAVPPPLVAASVATGLPAPAAATIAAVPASSSFGPAPVAAAGHAELPEQFYDAPELLLPPTPSSGGGQPEELDAAQLYLRYMCRTSDQTVGLLQVGAWQAGWQSGSGKDNHAIAVRLLTACGSCCGAMPHVATLLRDTW